MSTMNHPGTSKPASRAAPPAASANGRHPGRGGEPGHVAAGFGHDDLGGAPPDPRDGLQPGDDGLERCCGRGDQCVQLGDLGGPDQQPAAWTIPPVTGPPPKPAPPFR